MNIYSMTNPAITAALGERLEEWRLTRNMTQQMLAAEIGITPKSYRQLAAGGGKLENYIAALRALHKLDLLENLLAPVPISPLQRLKMRGKERQRARPTLSKSQPGGTAPEEQGVDW